MNSAPWRLGLRRCVRPFRLATLGLAISAAPVLATEPLPLTVTTLIPSAGASVAQLQTIEVHFSEPVTNVEAHDLLINGSPAQDLVFAAPGVY